MSIGFAGDAVVVAVERWPVPGLPLIDRCRPGSASRCAVRVHTSEPVAGAGVGVVVVGAALATGAAAMPIAIAPAIKAARSMIRTPDW
jgi:hypothetical protein